MTPEGRAGIQARADAATAGPWEACGDGTCRCGMIYSRDPDAHIADAIDRSYESWPVIKRGESRDDDEAVMEKLEYGANGHDAQSANAIFIVHAREDIPALLEALRESEADNARLRALAHKMQLLLGPCIDAALAEPSAEGGQG